MFKTGFKAFVFSFSVSLFAIVSAHRVFCYKNPSEAEPLHISEKNIVLFLKKMSPEKAPTQKIFLNTLQNVSKAPAEPLKDVGENVILADEGNEIDFPLEAVSEEAIPPKIVYAENEDSWKNNILYSPDFQQENQEIEAEEIYSPKMLEVPRVAPPPIKLAAQKADVKNSMKEDSKEGISALLSKTARPLYDKEMRTIGNPDDLNHVALSDVDVPVESMMKDKKEEKPQEKKQTKKWKSADDEMWLVARANAGTKNLLMQENSKKNQVEVEKAFAKAQEIKGTQVAAEGGVDNLVIPLKEELKDPKLVPKLAYPSSSEDALKEKKMSEKESKILSKVEDDDVSLEAPKVVQGEEFSEKKEENNKGLLNKLNSMISKSTKSVSDARERAITKAQARRSLRKRLAKTRPVSIMPTEIRLSFQPNRAEISGQTLRWVQAFASKAAESSDVVLEIRIDGTTSPVLQQRRLNLLHNILTNKGVEYSKINTIFTSREPNSFVLRAIKAKMENVRNNEKKEDEYQAEHIQW